MKLIKCSSGSPDLDKLVDCFVPNKSSPRSRSFLGMYVHFMIQIQVALAQRKIDNCTHTHTHTHTHFYLISLRGGWGAIEATLY